MAGKKTSAGRILPAGRTLPSPGLDAERFFHINWYYKEAM